MALSAARLQVGKGEGEREGAVSEISLRNARRREKPKGTPRLCGSSKPLLPPTSRLTSEHDESSPVGWGGPVGWAGGPVGLDMVWTCALSPSSYG